MARLKRKFGFWGVFCIAAGAMISSGLFVLPGLAFANAGPAMVLAYALAGVMVIPAMFSQAELATAMPKSGGSYFFIERSMGPLPGTLAGLANWFSIALKAAFALIGIGAFARLIRPDGQISEWTIKGIAIGCCVFFMALNTLSVKGVGRLQIILVAVLLAIISVFVIAGVPATKHPHFADFMKKGWGEVFATAGLVFISFGGLTKVASVAEEVHHPGRNIPAGMFLAALVVTGFYIAAVFVVVGVMEAGELTNNLTPLSLAAEKFMGPGGMILLSVAAMLAFITTANSGILSASRSPMAMSRDGLLPGFLQKVSPRFGTPHVSILITSVFMITIIALLSIENLVKVASTMMIMLFLLVNVAVLIMRASNLQNYRPLFRAPLYPWIQISGIVLCAFLIVEMGAIPLITTGAFALAGVIWYFVYVRRSISRESALVYMVRSVVSKEIYRSELEEELKQIALERDDVIRDRFDDLVRHCDILDLDGSVPADEMFDRAADSLAGRMDIDKQHLLTLFRQREASSSTVIEPGLAIPHIIVDGENIFEMLLIRCKEGVRFSGQNEPVRAAFVLVGSRDERNYHLRALMAIAHIVQEHNFHQRWLDASNIEHLRDILLLSGRKRDVPKDKEDESPS
ncbi:MAG: amino acid permease [Planctomycetota bacterium]|nr:amino acid permease [Planctomycetota bacterium]